MEQPLVNWGWFWNVQGRIRFNPQGWSLGKVAAHDISSVLGLFISTKLLGHPWLLSVNWDEDPNLQFGSKFISFPVLIQVGMEKKNKCVLGLLISFGMCGDMGRCWHLQGLRNTLEILCSQPQIPPPHKYIPCFNWFQNGISMWAFPNVFCSTEMTWTFLFFIFF